MSLSSREAADFDPLANSLEEDEPEVFVPPVLNPKPKARAPKSSIPEETSVETDQPAPVASEPQLAEPKPRRVLPEFSGFGGADAEQDDSSDVFDKPKNRKKGAKKEANFGAVAEHESYTTSLFGAADGSDEDEVQGLFEAEQHKTLVGRMAQDEHKSAKPRGPTLPAAPTNDSTTIAASLASLQNEDRDDMFLDSLSNLPAQPLFPQKDVMVSRAHEKAAVPLAVDDDLFSSKLLGGQVKTGNSSASGGASGFDFDSYIKSNQGASSGGLFD